MAPKKKRQVSRRWFRAAGFWISIILSFVVVVLYVFSRPAFDPKEKIKLFGLKDILEVIEAKYLNMRFFLRGERQPGDDIVIIAVDEKTDDELGRWQTSGRRWIAKMLDILHEGGAKVVGFDVTLAEPDEGAALVAIDEIKTRLLENSQEEIPNQAEIFTYLDEVKAAYDYDGLLAEAIRRSGNVVLGMYHFFDERSAAHITPEKHDAYSKMINRVKYGNVIFPSGHTRKPLLLIHSYGVEPNLPIFSHEAKSFGHFNVEKDRDGYIRKALLLVEYRGNYYPSLDLEIVRTYLHPSLPPIIYAWERGDGGSIDHIQIGEIRIPTDEKGRLLINYYGPGYTFPHYSISDVVLRKIPPDTFKDKIVLLGFTSAIYQDLHSTPFQQDIYPGVEVHATIIENILRQDFLTRPEATILIDILLIVLLGIVLGLILHRTHPISGALTAVICLISVAGTTYAAFSFQKIWLNMTYPFIFVILDYVAITSYKYFTEEKKKKEVKNAFQHYVSPAIVDQMLERVDQLHLGGERKQLTALFSDIRGFTSISEKMPPEDLIHFLNEYLTAMARIVLDHEGTVDKYMGDAIMAFYGAPLEQSDHAFRACKTAVEMIARLKELQIGWEARNLPPMNIGIGINSGEMSVGNMGSEERFDYTIMGDNVNLASRLEGINKQYGTNIVISQSTYELVQDQPFIVRELDSVQVKGKLEPVTIYELRKYGEMEPQTQTLLEEFDKGLHAYKNRQWDQAIASFQEALRIEPGDEPSKIYITRCEEYKQTPPPEDWNGVFVMKTK
jgi:adenylate cyclase